jgi:serine beta-lactamase-like protein LACTB, mitochondrial
MSKNRNRLKTWAALIVLTAGGLLAVIVGRPVYLSANATPLHPQPESAPSVARSEPSPQWSAAVDRARHIMRAGLAGQNLPGLSVAVGAGENIVWAEGFGWADMRTGRRVTPDTRFRIGTASTVLTSAAVGVLLEQGRLTLDGEMQTYVPQFPKKAWPLTLRQVMGHVAGVASDDEDGQPLSQARCERPTEALPHFADRELLFEPGTQYRYSKYGWVLVSAAVEAAAGQPFLTFMREQVFRPLGMDETGAESATKENPEDVGGPGEDPPPFTLIRELILEPLGLGGTQATSATGESPDPATFYVPGWGPHPDFRHGLHVRHPRNLSCYAGAMAFFSTPSDLVRFGLATNGGTLLQPATAQLLRMPRQLAGELLGAKVVSLTRGENGVVVAVTSNASYADTSALALKVAEAFAERP